jgi:S1-C subfamily serine protease
MTLLRIAAASAAACLVALGAHASEAKRDRMPAKPEFGAPSTDAMPPVVMNADAGRQASGLPPSRLSRSMRAAVAADEAPTRGKVEEKLFATYARSVVLVVLPEGLGSGAVIGKDGTIVTNNHVAGGFKSVGVIFKPRRAGAEPRIAEAVEAKVLYVDEVADLAIIKVAKLPPDVKPFALGDLRKLAVGADVHAIGHPVGESWSYTKGVVSQIRPDYEWRYETGPQHRADVVQTQTPINPGNSGGPLLNSAGEIVGLNTFGGGRAQGINFAVAVTEIKRFVALRKDRRAPDAPAALDETMPAAPLPAAQRSTPACEVKRLEARRTSRDDATGHLLDTNCDGTVDAILIVPDNKREPIELLIDANQNQTVDAVYVDEDRDLKFDYVLFDTDEDGVTDMIGVDLDQDLKPARFLAMRA